MCQKAEIYKKEGNQNIGRTTFGDYFEGGNSESINSKLAMLINGFFTFHRRVFTGKIEL